jgi:hypothetical protein
MCTVGVYSNEVWLIESEIRRAADRRLKVPQSIVATYLLGTALLVTAVVHSDSGP